MKPICLFFHCVFFDEKGCPFPSAEAVVAEQMLQLSDAGLLEAAREMWVGINGDAESLESAGRLLPSKAKLVLHGLKCHTENRTILMLEKWLAGRGDWAVLYFHTRGASHPPGHFSHRWRGCMMRNCVVEWRRCVADLESGFEAVGCHWMVPPATPPGQHIFAGNFFWATGCFLTTVPSLMARDRIKNSGLDSLESRYEAEVWLGNGPRFPRVRDYHGPNWDPSKVGTCSP